MELNTWQQKYLDERASANALREGIVREDVLAPMTGGGVTFDAVCAVAEYLAFAMATERGETPPKSPWKGEWQRDAVKHVMDNIYSTEQMGRRLGKSYGTGLIGTTYMGAGLPVIGAMPTMQQGSRQIFRQISRNLSYLGQVFYPLRRRLIDNMSNILLPNAGELTLLSADKGAEKEGYGGAFLFVDEAHKCDISTLSIFQPFTDDYIAQGVGRVLLLGIGGPEESAIEYMQNPPEYQDDMITEDDAPIATKYAPFRLDADELAEKYPELKPRFDAARRLLSTEEYNQHYRCKPVPIGTRMIYPALKRQCQGILESDTPRYVFGIDVGKKKDATVVCTLRVKDSKSLGLKTLELIDFHEIKGSRYPEQASQIMEYIWGYYKQARERELNNICIETNGPGEALADILEDTGIVDLQRSWTDEKWKRLVIRELQQGARQGWFAVPDSIAYRQLASLSFEIDGFGKEKWEHNDLHSALLVAAEIA